MAQSFSFILNELPENTEDVLSSWLSATTTYWNLVIDHTRNETSEYIDSPLSDESLDKLVTRFAQIHTALWTPKTTSGENPIHPRWRTRLGEVRRIPEEILRLRMSDILRTIVDEVKPKIQDAQTKAERRPFLAKLPRHKSAGSTKSIRFPAELYRREASELVFTITGVEVVIPLSSYAKAGVADLARNYGETIDCVITHRKSAEGEDVVSRHGGYYTVSLVVRS